LIFEKLHLTGPGGSPYELGEPMHVHDGTRFLGTVEPVEVGPDRTEVRISRFSASPSVGSGQRNFGPLLLVEVTLFLVERFRDIQSVHFDLRREIEVYGDGMMVAAARAELLRSIGATDVHALPQPDPSNPGNFVVRGVWVYTEDTLLALRLAVALQRDLYGENLDRASKKKRGLPVLRRFKRWWPRDDGA
jgi:hypothetical protein